MKECIKHAAVISESGMILLGKCHADCFYQGHNIGLKMSSKADDQGFVTSRGRYVGRELAAAIAKKAGQFKKDGKKKPTVLISEDIWHQIDRFIYTQQLGYIEVVGVAK
jgi:hypothetical protein